MCTQKSSSSGSMSKSPFEESEEEEEAAVVVAMADVEEEPGWLSCAVMAECDKDWDMTGFDASSASASSFSRDFFAVPNSSVTGRVLFSSSLSGFLLREGLRANENTGLEMSVIFLRFKQAAAFWSSFSES